MLTAEQRKAYIQTIRSLPDDLHQLVDGLTREQLTTSPAEDEWTIAQVVHHLVDSHTNSYLRLKLILTTERPAMQILEEGELAQLPDATEADIQHSLSILSGLHHRWCVMWDHLTDEQWQRVGVSRGTREMTPDYLVEVYANHSQNHLNQIKNILEAIEA